jgi:ABC-type antimicrobial peptide transport system permease subunit
MKKGRFFSDDFGADDQTIVVNPRAVESLGYTDPLGKQVMVFDKHYKIIGVTEDYISVPPIIERMPLLILKSGNQSNYLTIRVQPEQREIAHRHIKTVLHGINPNQPVEMTYYDDVVMENAKTYIATEVFIRTFTLIIIVNAMLGLFSLSFFMSERKTKEIGVRKVCGAQVRDVLWKLSSGFIKKLVLAFAIATPLGYVIGQGYISTFVSRIDLTPDIFILGGFISLVMVVISTGWKIAHAANQNPVRALKYE